MLGKCSDTGSQPSLLFLNGCVHFKAVFGLHENLSGGPGPHPACHLLWLPPCMEGVAGHPQSWQWCAVSALGVNPSGIHTYSGPVSAWFVMALKTPRILPTQLSLCLKALGNSDLPVARMFQESCYWGKTTDTFHRSWDVARPRLGCMVSLNPSTLIQCAILSLHHRVLRAPRVRMMPAPVAVCAASTAVHVSQAPAVPPAYVWAPSPVPSASFRPAAPVWVATPATIRAPVSPHPRALSTAACALPNSMGCCATSWTTASQEVLGETFPRHRLRRSVSCPSARWTQATRSATSSATTMHVAGMVATAPSTSTTLGRTAHSPCSAGSISVMAAVTASATQLAACLTASTASKPRGSASK